jgi:hypothetical protein
MWRKIILTAIASIGLSCAGLAQYYTINLDSQSPAEQPVIDRAFSGNSIFLRAYCFDSGVAVDLTPWTMTFRYSYGQYSTQGMVTVNGVVSSNRVDFTGLTNIYAKPFDNYYWSISGIKDTGLIKTFGTGTLKVEYDPATSTNIVTLMEQVNISWMTNWLGAQVESNRLNIIVLTTGKTDLITYNTHIAAQANTNSGFESRISFNETFRITTQPATNAAIQNQITANLTNQEATNAAFEPRIVKGETAFGWGNWNLEGFLKATVNIFSEFFVADRSQLGANIAGLTQGTYTGSLTSVSYTGVTVMVIGRTYAWGFTKANAFGTSTLSIASQTLSATAAGVASNQFAYHGTDTNLILKLDGDGSSKSDVTAVYVRQITNGNMHVAGDLDVGGKAIAGTIVLANSGEQVLNDGGTITPYSNVKVNNTNGVTIALGNPQVATNGVADGTIMYLRGATGTGGIQFINGNGVATDCELGFLLKPEDVMQFVFFSGQWTEVKRLDK